jgi:hypothetical protein
MPKLGERVAYRPIPADFEERFVKLGLNGARGYYHARFSTVTRWVEQCGGDALREKRYAYLQEHGRAKTGRKVWHRHQMRQDWLERA